MYFSNNENIGLMLYSMKEKMILSYDIVEYLTFGIHFVTSGVLFQKITTHLPFFFKKYFF